MSNTTEQRIRQILSSSPAIIYTCRADGDFSATFVSDNFSFRFGYAPHEFLNQPDFWKNNIHPDDKDRVLAAYDALFANGYHSHEYRFRKKNGDYLWVHDELQLICDDDGSPVEIVGSWLDITDRKKTEEALRKSESLFRDFFYTNPAATIISSPSGVIHLVNPAFTKETDFTPEEVVGRTAQELNFWRIPEDRDRMVKAIMEHGFIDNLESKFYGKNNKSMDCLISSRAIEFEGDLRILSIVVDVTEQRKAEKVLSELEQAKSDFISTAAHELRTPLIAIVGYSELLENQANMPLSEEQRDSYISVIQSNAEILNRLVEDLLDVGRIQVGKPLSIKRKETRLAAVIEKVVESFRINDCNNEITFNQVNLLPDCVFVDPGRIAQVIYNLLDNAIKYSPDGGSIEISTSVGVGEFSIAISDHGLGMTKEQVEQVFDRFYRAPHIDSKSTGLGLGMGIVKQIVLDHGGRVNIDSVVGAGTTVTITLPLKPSTENN